MAQLKATTVSGALTVNSGQTNNTITASYPYSTIISTENGASLTVNGYGVSIGSSTTSSSLYEYGDIYLNAGGKIYFNNSYSTGSGYITQAATSNYSNIDINSYGIILNGYVTVSSSKYIVKSGGGRYYAPHYVSVYQGASSAKLYLSRTGIRLGSTSASPSTTGETLSTDSDVIRYTILPGGLSDVSNPKTIAAKVYYQGSSSSVADLGTCSMIEMYLFTQLSSYSNSRIETKMLPNKSLSKFNC